MAARFIAISLVTKRAGIAACLVTVVTKRIVATKRAAADNPFRHVYIYKETKAIAFSERFPVVGSTSFPREESLNQSLIKRVLNAVIGFVL